MWTAIDALREYVYISQHAAAFRKEKNGCIPFCAPVDSGEAHSFQLRKPSRDSCRQQHEDGAMAFSFAHPPEMPLQPDIDLR